MQLYRLPVLFLLLTSVMLLGTKLSEQRTLIRRHTTDANDKISSKSNDTNTNQSNSQDLTILLSPFIVLMSRNTIAVAQLPMIENGNLSEVYHLIEDPKEIGANSSDEDFEQDGKDLEKEEVEAEDQDEEDKIRNSYSADAREYEQQMPKSAIVNINNDTTTSLGKSEWQQIASAAAAATSSAVSDREEVWPQTQTMPSAGNNRKENKQMNGEEEITRPRRRRRVRRSNSSNYDEDGSKSSSKISNDAGSGSGNSSDSGSSSPSNNQQENNTEEEKEEAQTKRVNRAEESSNAQNVTSAQSATNSNNEYQQRQPNSRGGVAGAAAGGPRTEEDDDKNSRRNTQILSTTSPDSSTTFSQPSANTAEGVHFCDFDVHMALGYAFVADSTGRIHRFKLPSGSSSSPSIASHTRETLKKATSDVSSVENDYVNTIDAGTIPRLSSSLKQFKLNTGIAEHRLNSTTVYDSNSNNIQLDENVNHLIDDVGQSNAARKSHNDNKVSVHNPDEFTQHEQLALGERLHPNMVHNGQSHVSFAESGNSASVTAGAPISGASFLAKQRNNDEIQLSLQSAEPRIIWSRNKFKAAALSARKTASKGALQKAHRQQQQQLATARRGASPSKDGLNNHQVVDGAAGEQQGGTVGESQITTPLSGGQSESKSDKQLSELQHANLQNSSSGKRSLKTKIAVDWLSNLLFVLDKYRLFVVDFHGNNELLLIDDFNSITRPLEIKVDPVNNFLFWLQAGRFYNTIYKLDLNVLSMPSATQRLIGNTLKLRQIGAHNNFGNNNNNSAYDVIAYDSSDLVALVSHHYAHPIITNLPRHTKLFTIDHKHSRIYVPLSPTPTASDNVTPLKDADSDEQSKRDDAEVFAPSNDATTHLNSTELEQFSIMDNCTVNMMSKNTVNGQILAYNLDGTDVGPLRSVGENSHITSLDDVLDFTLDTENNLLYWLTNNGRELFEEYKEGATIHPAQHNLDGNSYLKLAHFDKFGSNQPITKEPRKMREIIQMLSSSLPPNRLTRSDGNEQLEDNLRASKLNARLRPEAHATQFSRNAPYIILGVTCLIVITVYLIYTLIFQQMSSNSNDASHSHNDSIDSGSIEGGSSSRSDGASPHIGTGGFLSPRWPAPGPSMLSTDTSTFNRDLNSANGQLGAYDLGSSNYDASNAIDEHYRDSQISHANYCDGSQSFDLKSTGIWPAGMLDVFNKLYVPKEMLQDEALSSIRMISIDQLEIERKVPLGEGHFGTVLQGRVSCSIHEKESPINGSRIRNNVLNQRQIRLSIPPSTTSSGHGSSSSTSGEFITANSCTEGTNNDDYLTPKNQFNSSDSDCTIDNVTSVPSRRNTGDCFGETEVKRIDESQSETKIRVAIKKLKENASSEEKRDFLQEAKLLANFDHPNIVHLIGICLDRGSTLIVMELMLGGDLIRYMQENTPKSMADDADKLTYDDLLKICLDIVNGCCYLEDLDYIHRDLAARNCLVSSRKREERIVKLADFGLARDIYKDSYYKKLNDSAMPLKWMAPECLIEQKFTKKSDVWSFGVVMWEVMSYCQQKPYGGVEPFLMKEHLVSGARLAQPRICDDNMYKLMNQCWQMEPDRRPSFNELRAILIEIRNNRAL